VVLSQEKETVGCAELVANGTVALAFLEALSKSTGESIANLSKRVGEAARARFRKGKQDGVFIGVVGATAMIVVTDDLPDEARLALLDLDVTADEMRGKTLRWDNEAMAWRPDTVHED
jgi:hypothetical protein